MERCIDYRTITIITSKERSGSQDWSDTKDWATIWGSKLVNQFELIEFKKQLNNLLAMGYIRPRKSLNRATVFFKDKNDGTVWMWINYRALNKVSTKNNYPLLQINGPFEKLARTKYFRCIELKSRYYQTQIVDGDIEKIACHTTYWYYEFLVIPYELCNMPSAFITLMNTIFCKEMDDFEIIYIDDIESIPRQQINTHNTLRWFWGSFRIPSFMEIKRGVILHNMSSWAMW